ncbi:redoxin domain-containing protein [uncultured Flavobacterium sp.]|uniref:peroxiredoxin family protein n=1 Tax=uncultured Flavobacterium sp. TaxID=165435 RepID=UPI0030820E1B
MADHSNKLDFENLYTSGLWSPVIETWAQMQQYAIKDDAVFFEDTKTILSRIKNKGTYTAFADKMVGVFAKAGKDVMVSDLGRYLAQSGQIEKAPNRLISAMNDLVAGSTAPFLQTPAGKKAITKKTLLFFYESGCNNCENEIHQLLGNYQIVKDKGYEVITVAADMTKEAGDGHGHEFPWKEQLCDYKGFAGPNFISYGIIGTPTFFTIDEKGKITGRYARLIDANILNNFVLTTDK